jgi:hypothetical protein
MSLDADPDLLSFEHHLLAVESVFTPVGEGDR